MVLMALISIVIYFYYFYYLQDLFHMGTFGKGKKVVPVLAVKPKNAEYGHMIFIRNLDMFLKISRRRTNGMVYEQKSFWCYKCIQPFTNESARDAHMGICSVSKPQQEVYANPDKDTGRLKPWIEFSQFDNQYKLPIFGV